MEEKIALVTDSGSDIHEYPELEKIAKNVHVYVLFGDKSFSTSEIKMKEYHSKLQAITKRSDWPTTSAPSPEDFEVVYQKLHDEGYKKVISIHLAEKLSATLNSANIARNMIPELSVELIDTQSCSIGELASVIKAKQLIDAGEPFDHVVLKLKEFVLQTRIYVTLDTLDYLRMGGRISHVKYRLGKILRMKPIIIVGNGVIDTYDKTRNTQKSRDKVYSYATKGFNKEDTFNYVIGHTRSSNAAEEMEKQLQNEFPNAKGYVGEISTAICTHTGPNAVGIITFK